ASRTISDTAPVINTLTLNPNPPGTNATLTAALTATDIDLDSMLFTYVWKKNNIEMKRTTNVAATSDTYDLSAANNGDVNDVSRVEVTASSFGKTSVVSSTQVVVQP